MAPALKRKLQISSGTMQLGGQITVTFQNYSPSEGGGRSWSGHVFGFNPTFGYFVVNGLEVMTRFSLLIKGGDLYTESSKQVGFGLGFRYVLDAGMVNPYVGLLLGMDFWIPPDEAETSTEKFFDITGLLGILIPLNQHVAISLGMEIIYQKGLNDVGWDIFSLPIGFGVEGFF
jgi:hypothetical protein